jgi:hypothetical protein
MRARSCGVVRRQLSAYHDRELGVGEQIAIEGHLRQCADCQSQARELQSLSVMIRGGSAAATGTPDLGAFASSLVSRMKAERAESFAGQTRRLFDDSHLVWAALGATGATVACLAIAFTLFYFAARERPDSLRAMMAAMSSPAGSNQNPFAQLDESMRLPSAVNDAFPEAVTNDDDAVFALAAVVTREGRIKNLKMLHGGDGTAPTVTRQERQEIEALLDTISKTRFVPARFGNSPVAVNMVWLYAHVNVRGKIPAGSRLESAAPVIMAALPPAGRRAV